MCRVPCTVYKVKRKLSNMNLLRPGFDVKPVLAVSSIKETIAL